MTHFMNSTFFQKYYDQDDYRLRMLCVDFWSLTLDNSTVVRNVPKSLSQLHSWQYSTLIFSV